MFGRSLYLMSFAELGSSVAELEELSNVLSLVSHWGALMLFDEGDALIEKKNKWTIGVEFNDINTVAFDGMF